MWCTVLLFSLPLSVSLSLTLSPLFTLPPSQVAIFRTPQRRRHRGNRYSALGKFSRKFFFQKNVAKIFHVPMISNSARLPRVGRDVAFDCSLFRSFSLAPLPSLSPHLFWNFEIIFPPLFFLPSPLSPRSLPGRLPPLARGYLLIF
jgi:hypothetical protein